MKEKLKKRLKQTKGITLVALVVTIIVLLILAGVILGLVFNSDGLFEKTNTTAKKYNMEQAREKLEVALANAKTEKFTKTSYDKEADLNKELIKNNIIVDGDLVTVENWVFQIDRDILTIIDSIGEGKLNDNIKITVNKQANVEGTNCTLSIEVENIEEIEYIRVNGKEITNVVKDGNVYKATTVVEENGEYKIIAKAKNGEYNIQNIKVEELAGNMDIHSIEDWQQFNKLAQEGKTFRGKTINLYTNLDLQGTKHEPIPNFEGTLNGNNNTIDNLTIEKTGDSVGIFKVTTNATIENLNLTKVNVKNNGPNFGAITGAMIGGAISNVHVDGNITGTQTIGGIVGWIGGANSEFKNVIKDCSVNVNITGIEIKGPFYDWGGIVGIIGGIDTEIISCYSSGTINRNIVGGCDGGIIGSIVQQEGYLEEDESHMKIERCYSDMTINGRDDTGGIIGSVKEMVNDINKKAEILVENCMYKGIISNNTKSKSRRRSRLFL